MGSEAPKRLEGDTKSISYDEEFYDDEELVTGIRSIVRDLKPELPRPDTKERLKDTETQYLSNRVEMLVDKWFQQRMMTGAFFMESDEIAERMDIVESTLRDCQAKAKIAGFQSTYIDGKLAYFIEYSYR